MRNALRIVSWLLLWLPLAAFTQTITSTSSFSTGVGATNSVFAWTTQYVGPQTIPTGNQGMCTIPPPPYPGCTPFGGSGTTADPFTFVCDASPPPLSGCTLPGTPFTIAAGGIDFDTHTHTQTAHVLDIDGNGSYDALTDGLLAIRYLFGLSGAALINGAVGPGAARITATDIGSYLTDIKPFLDIDGNGQADAFTDGILIVRYLFGLRGAGLIAGAIGPNAIRTTAAAIETQLQSLTPP